MPTQEKKCAHTTRMMKVDITDGYFIALWNQGTVYMLPRRRTINKMVEKIKG